ncbi:hypothetical protein [Thermaerobacillus caldiproteolyticus]|uniref:hypothetical protein n=1 Tax=Thermaerobacillus caldiproteolyticus TaxID=247480 RepID=UPI0018F2015B|nr:hypothetical protein [Anoxybacillus caldiproteolyticus]
MFKKLKEKLRWKIVFLLNERKDTCWSDLADWAMGNSGDYTIRDYIPPKIGGSKWYTGVRRCRQDARLCGSCYCGKFVSEQYAADRPKSIVVTSEIEEEDAPDVAYITFKD